MILAIGLKGHTKSRFAEDRMFLETDTRPYPNFPDPQRNAKNLVRLRSGDSGEGKRTQKERDQKKG